MKIKRKSLKASSKRWIQRQSNDLYVRRAKYEGYRSRSAYKLLEIQEKFALMKPGHTVVDLGCSPGSWSQVAVRSTKSYDPTSNSLVIGLDIKDTEPIDGAVLINGLDFVQDNSHVPVIRALNKRQVNVLLSDMAPNMTGHRFVDHCKVANLCYAALEIVQRICMKGASLVMKVFDGEECKEILTEARKLFEFVKVYHTKATRKPSSEMFYVGLRYTGKRLYIPNFWNDRIILE